MTSMQIFIAVGGAFSILSVFPLGYLALRSVREARELRLIQYELARLMREAKETGEEVHALQRKIRREQEAASRTIEETKRAVEQTAEQVTDVVEQAAGHVAVGVAAPELSQRAVLRDGRLQDRPRLPGAVG